jgi:hypothetical protein
MNLKLTTCLISFSLLFSCTQGDQKEKPTAVSGESKPAVEGKITLTDKGITRISIGPDADFGLLKGLKTNKINGVEYLSFFDTQSRSIYLNELETGQIVNIIKLQNEGPNQVQSFSRIDYFFHSLDSIFIDTHTAAYYLINDKGEVLKKMGKSDGSFGERSPVSFEGVSYFDGKLIHGDSRIPFPSTAEDFVYTRASFEPTEVLKVEQSLESKILLNNFEEIMSYRKEIGTIFKIPRQFVRNNRYLFGTTPLSDSIFVFENNQLVESIYAGQPDVDLIDFKEYLNINQVKRQKGEVRRVVATKQSPYFINTLIDPEGMLIYRVLMEGTQTKVNINSGDTEPEIIGARLVEIHLKTGDISTLELPIDQIELKIPNNNEVFVDSNGIHFKAKEQQNENEVLFRVFGPS